MADSCIERLASVLVGYSANVQPGELVTIEGPLVATPLIVEIYREVLRAGGNPLPKLKLPREVEILFAEASDAQLDWVDPAFLAINETADVRIIVDADTNTKSLSNVAPARQARRSRAREASRNRYLERAAAGELKWVLTAFPTEAGAQDAEMSLAEYEHFVYGAGRLFEPDPVASWQGFAKHAFAAKAFLEGVRELRIVAEGTDLTLSVDGRTWEPSVGKENFPDGEVFTAPIETKVDGTIRFTYPAVFQGREVNDVELRFEGGEVVGSSASHGLEFLREMIGMDDGRAAARRVRVRPQRRHRPLHAQHPLRREDRRHRPPRARDVVSRDRRPQPLRPALGHHLRPPHGQRGLRGRRARLPRRQVPPGVL